MNSAFLVHLDPREELVAGRSPVAVDDHRRRPGVAVVGGAHEEQIHVGVSARGAGDVGGGLEYLRDVAFLKLIFGEQFDPKQWRMVIFGFLMVSVMVWRPRGLIANRTPSIALKERRAIGADLVKEGHG